ncbi:MAG: lipid-A-disaccharide synthase, partial [candidate division KSB1 bacterium]|nr:lipid-A-disaccharide synthase [candidate division KSB1 bacterium]
YHINDMSVLGFWDVLRRLRFFRKVYRQMIATMNLQRPALLILIDYPGLNLKLAAAARERSIKVFYYIAPQVWAWGASRIPKMAQLIDRMAVILPFEEAMFRQAGIAADFVGHPLLETVISRMDRKDFFQKNGLDVGKKTIGLLPGSRPLEVKRLLPEMLEIVRRLQQKYPQIQTIIGKASSLTGEIYAPFLTADHQAKLLDNCTYEVMQHSDLLLVASGTATLESALFATPMIIAYKVDPLSYIIARSLVKIDAIGLVNVIAGHKIVPEFIQHEFRWQNVLPEAETLLFDHNRRQSVITDLKNIKTKLGQPGASARAATLALDLMDSVS